MINILIKWFNTNLQRFARSGCWIPISLVHTFQFQVISEEKLSFFFWYIPSYLFHYFIHLYI